MKVHIFLFMYKYTESNNLVTVCIAIEIKHISIYKISLCEKIKPRVLRQIATQKIMTKPEETKA